MTYTKENLREIFQQSYQQEVWNGVLREFFRAKTLKLQPEVIENTNDNTTGFFLGSLDTPDGYNIGLFHFDIKDSNIARKRVGLRQLVKHFVNPKWGLFDATLVVFVGEDNWRLSFVCDIKGEATSPKRYTFLFGDKDNRYNTAVSRFIQLQEAGITFANIKDAFSVEALSKEFYTRLYKWYEWALSEEAGITFPDMYNQPNSEPLNIKLIRLITRLLFVWFIKQKKLVPEELFSPDYLKTILRDFNAEAKDNGYYYNAILQNLFFATLNCAIVDEKGESRRFATDPTHRDTKNKYRYVDMFSLSDDEAETKKKVIELFANVPYLNGGLFECLDKPTDSRLGIKENTLYDGFSRKGTYIHGHHTQRAFIPNKLFFNEDENQPGLITLLKEYNFTIEENSRDDAEVSLDPELLGQVFENLLAAYNPETQVSARKATGSFYTPRVIVDYMVDEALIAYIKTKQIEGVTEESLRELFRTHTKNQEWNQGSIEALTMALKKVKILDPACGSGAFPMGCLLRIVDILETLSDDENFDRYDTKLKIIENCIYGVDIQSIAMMICKLRFFISLICDQQNIDFDKPKENFGVKTLPNLETKFVAANTLLCAEIRKFENTSDLLLPNDETLKNMKDELLDIRNKHLVAKSMSKKKQYQDDDEKMREKIHDYIVESASKPNDEKIASLEKELEKREKELASIKNGDQLIQTQVVEQESLFGEKTKVIIDLKEKRIKEKERQIQSIKDDISRERNKSIIQGFEAAVKQLTDWNPYDQNSVSPFFDAEWMFGVIEGFDIVIGNPPYIQLSKNGGELAKKYFDCKYTVFENNGDIYCLFYERGQQLLKESGLLCFITSNKWMRAGYGEKLRAFLANETNPALLIDFGGVEIFKSATVDTNILLFTKSDNTHKTLCVDFSRHKSKCIDNLSVFVEQESAICDFPNSDTWVILSTIEQSIKRKIESVGTPLKDWDIDIYRGILTGCNEAFIISTAKREEILTNCKSENERNRTAELIRPILRGRDIKRYGYNWANLWLINTHNGIRGKLPRVDVEGYPTLKQYLDNHWNKIRTRDDQGDTPYNLRSCAYLEEFNKPKIIYGQFQDSAEYSFDDNGVFLSSNEYFIVCNNYSAKCLLVFLNSKVIEWILDKTTGNLGGNSKIAQKSNFLKVPIPILNDTAKFDLLADLRIKGERTDKEIDEVIYQFYNLSHEEIKIIESQ